MIDNLKSKEGYSAKMENNRRRKEFNFRSFLKSIFLRRRMTDGCSACAYAKKYLGVFFITFLILISVFAFNMLAIIKSYALNVDMQISYNIYEYNEVDYEQLCRIANCKYVVIKDIKTIHKGRTEDKLFISHIQIVDRKVTLTHSHEAIPYIRQIFGNYHFDDRGNIILYNKEAKAYFALDLSLFLQEMKYTYSITFLVVYLVVFILMYVSHRRQEHEHIIQTYGTEAILSNQSMIMITENVHHELNTPLEVIENKLEKIKRTIQEYILGEFKEFKSTPGAVLTPEKIKINNKMVRLTKDFDFVQLSLEQVFSTLDRMRGFKQLKYSNGNKTVYDICEGACQIMIIRNSGFDYEIDEELKNYKLRHTSSKDLKNVDFLNILINHLKNSLEAKSSLIRMELGGFSKDKLQVHIVDNGNGIPKDFMSEVFKPNFSTKSTKDTVRGNGMYLNKYILNNSGGDVDIIDSNENGTIIEIFVQSEKIPDET